MTALHTYAAGFGATLRARPATEPVPGDGGVVVVVPTDTWLDIDALLADSRPDTSAAILVAPELQREGFTPNVVATTSVITPAVPADGLLGAVEASMDGVEGWRVRARVVTPRGGGAAGGDGDDGDDGRADANHDSDDDNSTDLTLDLVAEYRVGQCELALSSLVRARSSVGQTVLWQIHVTTLADQLSHHGAALEAARLG